MERINTTSLLARNERAAAINEVLHSCRGHILKLARYASEQMITKAELPAEKLVSDVYAYLIRTDAESSDGLSESARIALVVAKSHLAETIAGELENGSLSLERTLMLLHGIPGAALVQRAIVEPLLAVLGLSSVALEQDQAPEPR
jgi:hypothetical protein